MNLFSLKNRDPFLPSKSVTGFSGLVFDRDHDRDCTFLNRDPITKRKSPIDFEIKIADRFS